jgi:hypothetical protein
MDGVEMLNKYQSRAGELGVAKVQTISTKGDRASPILICVIIPL